VNSRHDLVFSAEYPASNGSAQQRFFFGAFVLCAVVALQQVAQYITNHDTQRLGSVLLLFSFQLPTLLYALSKWFDWSRKHELRSSVFIGVGMLWSAIIGAFWGGLFYVVSELWPELGLRAFSNDPKSATRLVLYGLTQAQSHFGLWTLGFVLPAMLEDVRVRELKAQKLAAESEQLRTAAELARLRGHLEPHFLLNTLNAIAGLVSEEPRQARRMISALGELLRDALHDAEDPQPLWQQVAWLKRYAQILETRHRGDLRFSWEIGPATERHIVPRLLLQPLVENAVKHGALRAGDPGHVHISSALSEDGRQLVCMVVDNGPGFPEGPVRNGAVGLTSVRRSLQLRYGDAAQLSLHTDHCGQGAIAKVEIPLDQQPAGTHT